MLAILVLNVTEMNALSRELKVTSRSGQCKHGRPIWVKLVPNDVEKLFGRLWVDGAIMFC